MAVALITGASSHIGLATAVTLARAGHTSSPPCATSTRPTRRERLKSQLPVIEPKPDFADAPENGGGQNCVL